MPFYYVYTLRECSGFSEDYWLMLICKVLENMKLKLGALSAAALMTIIFGVSTVQAASVKAVPHKAVMHKVVHHKKAHHRHHRHHHHHHAVKHHAVKK